MTTANLRLWTTLALAAGATTATGQAIAPTFAVPAISPFVLVQSGGEAGEAGEGGEAGALATVDGSVALLAALGLIEGHLRTGMALLATADAAGSGIHANHPREEIYADIEPLLEAQGVAAFADELAALSDAVASGASAAATQAAFDALLARFAEVRDAASPADRLTALSQVLRTAADEYGIGVVDGAIANLFEYQDAYGFVQMARAEAERLAALPDPAAAAAGTEVRGFLADTEAAFARGVAPVGAMPTDGVPRLSGAAARIELAALALGRP